MPFLAIFIQYGKIPAGRLLEEVGAKGTRRGDAQFAPHHANLLVNRGRATSRDILELTQEYAQRVRQRFGIHPHAGDPYRRELAGPSAPKGLMTMRKFLIRGGHKLYGDYPVQGNKNAALPLIAATLLARSRVELRSVPRIGDVENLLLLMQALGCQVNWRDSGSLIVDSRFAQPGEFPAELVEKLRGSILLLGALGAKISDFSCALPGGCPIGRRSFEMHWDVFRAAGFSIRQDGTQVRLKRDREVTMPRVYLEETSVTATENALLLFAGLGGGAIENPAREPHVLSLVDFLRRLGCEIEFHPLCYQVKSGVSPPGVNLSFAVPADYIDAGTLAIAAAATGGSVTLCGMESSDLIGIRNVLQNFGLEFRYPDEDRIEVSAGELANPDRIVAGPWPLFPTDLVSLAIVLASQGKGLCLVHDWMYEARMFFIDKLVRMGARITMCDPHRVLVEGPTQLRGTNLESPDIRAGMALVVAGLCAQGETVIEHSEVILRGYQQVAERLRRVGAEIREE